MQKEQAMAYLLVFGLGEEASQLNKWASQISTPFFRDLIRNGTFAISIDCCIHFPHCMQHHRPSSQAVLITDPR
jgi:hypothetical protein